MRKVDDGKRKKKKEKIMSFLVATNVVASRLPERRPTGTPYARANCHTLRYKITSRHFIIPVVAYSITFNIPKFLEVTTSCPPEGYLMANQTNQTFISLMVNSTSSTPSTCNMGQLVLVARDIRYPSSELFLITRLIKSN